jgi:hypothetical protein
MDPYTGRSLLGDPCEASIGRYRAELSPAFEGRLSPDHGARDRLRTPVVIGMSRSIAGGLSPSARSAADESVDKGEPVNEVDLTTELATEPAVIPSGCTDFDEARRLLADHREDEALDRFELAIASAADPAVRTSAAAHLAALLLGFGRPWEVSTFTDQVRRANVALADYLDAAACIQLDDPEGALARLGERGVPVFSQDPWYPNSIAAVRSVRARALAAADRLGDACYELDVAVDEAPEAPELWESIARIAADPGLDFDVAPYVARLPERALLQVFGWLYGSPLRGVDAIAEACWLRFGATHALLAAVSGFAPNLASPRALDWTVRIIQAGGNACPILDRAETAGLPLAERVRAAAAGALLVEERGRLALENATLALSDDEVESLAAEVMTVAPEVLDSYVVAAATTTPRCLALATVLSDHDRREPALAVLVHGLTLPGAEDLDNERFDILVPIRTRVVLAAAADVAGDDEIAALLRSVPTRTES